MRLPDYCLITGACIVLLIASTDVSCAWCDYCLELPRSFQTASAGSDDREYSEFTSSTVYAWDGNRDMHRGLAGFE